MIKFLCPVLACSLSFAALAQEGPGGGPDDQGPPRWGLGLAAVVTDSPYAGEGTRVMPIPLVSYHGERFYFEGLGAGWVFLKNDSFELAAVAKGRMDGFDVKDLGRSELARNGVDYRLLDDRDMGLDLGAKVKWSGRGGELEAELLADATDTSGGQEFSLQYGYGFDVGKARLTPNAGVTWQSKDMANYYYGTGRGGARRGRLQARRGNHPARGRELLQAAGREMDADGLCAVQIPAGQDHRQPLDRTRYQRECNAVHRVLARLLIDTRAMLAGASRWHSQVRSCRIPGRGLGMSIGPGQTRSWAIADIGR